MAQLNENSRHLQHLLPPRIYNAVFPNMKLGDPVSKRFLSEDYHYSKFNTDTVLQTAVVAMANKKEFSKALSLIVTPQGTR